MNHAGSQATMDRRRRPESNGGVKVVFPQPRRLAAPVGNARFHADPVPRLEVCDFRADTQDGPGRLMPQHDRLVHHERAEFPVPIEVDVAAADDTFAEQGRGESHANPGESSCSHRDVVRAGR